MDYLKLADEYLELLKIVKNAINFTQLYNFSNGENSLLVLLSKKGTVENVGNLAKKLDVVPSRVTAIVSSLEKKGYIIKFQDKDDKRMHYVTLSEKGELFLAESFLKVRSDFAEVLKRADYNDLLELKTALEKVLKNN